VEKPDLKPLIRHAQRSIIIIMKLISDKMSIETIKKKEKNPRTLYEFL